VGFGPAEDMINAVRNLQVVPPGEGVSEMGDVADGEITDKTILKEATHDAPIDHAEQKDKAGSGTPPGTPT